MDHRQRGDGLRDHHRAAVTDFFYRSKSNQKSMRTENCRRRGRKVLRA
jgi:hypothetical protein